MKQPSEKILSKLKKSVDHVSDWEITDSFSAIKPTPIKLSPVMIKNLQILANIRGEQSYQKLLIQWVNERILNEMKLIELVRKKHYQVK